MLNRTMLLVSLGLSALMGCGPDRNSGWMDVQATDAMDARADARGDAMSDIRTDIAMDARRDVPTDMVRVDTGNDTSNRVCAPSCNTDLECQSTCAPPAAGTSMCCSFNVCTVVGMPACPGSTDGGTCSTACTTSAQCATCGGGATCCFFGSCMAPPMGFCPDQNTDSGVPVEDVPAPTDAATDSSSPDVTDAEVDTGVDAEVDAAADVEDVVSPEI